MNKHTKVYCDFFKYDEGDFIPCEICGRKAVDIHHIESRGMGGSNNKDVIENLMAVCRKCHIEFGDETYLKEMLKNIHGIHMKNV
jgi:5-methylcytosine-specific restriction endonuclease McrA